MNSSSKLLGRRMNWQYGRCEFDPTYGVEFVQKTHRVKQFECLIDVIEYPYLLYMNHVQHKKKQSNGSQSYCSYRVATIE